MTIVNIENLVKKFGDVSAVDGITLKIEAGEIYGLLGPNGAGKTTLINMITGILTQDSGEISLFGNPMKKSNYEIKKQIGVVPQNVAVYEDMTAYENVKFFASLYDLSGKVLEKAVADALEFVGLEKNRKQAKSFSGGMKRRLNIACAIAHRPKLVIMDEPTVGIDPQSKHHILKAVKALNEQGSTIIYTTHLMEEAEFLCSRVGIIDHGQVIADGTVETLQNIVTDRKHIDVNVLEPEEVDTSKLKAIKGVEDVVISGDLLRIECLKESDVVGEIVTKLGDMEIGIKALNTREVSLESAFLSLTGRRLRDS